MKNINYDFKSFSKINFGLKVLNKRKDGYHNINSIFIELDFHDVLRFSPSKNFEFICDDKSIPLDNTNTVHAAYQALKKKFNFHQNYKIALKKTIPIGAGLGGGSSNAACTLKALKKILKLNVSKTELKNIALDIGSDVPFFLDGGSKLIHGRGEIINKTIGRENFKNMSFLLICPDFSISTQWAYKKLKKALKSDNKEYKFPPLHKKGNWKLFENDFEVVVKTTYPEIMDIKQIMYDNGALYSSLSGTGSTVFGIYNEEKFILNTQNKLTHYKTYRASPT